MSILTTNRKPGGKRAAMIGAILAIIILVAAAIFCVYIFTLGDKDPQVTVSKDGISIKGMYGLDIPWSEVEGGITLLEQSMAEIGAGRRVNGYAGFGDGLKGFFSSEELGRILLFVKASSSPTIKIGRGEKEDVYISLADGEKTRELYGEIEAALSGNG